MESHKIEKYFFQKGKRLRAELPKTYLSKPTVIYRGKSVWPEIAALLKFKGKGYKGVWVDTFHRKLWENEKKQVSLADLPEKIRVILKKGTSGCWDLVIWKGKEIKFIELKGIPSRDRIRESQIKFRDKLLKNGFVCSDFSVVEWDYK